MCVFIWFYILATKCTVKYCYDNRNIRIIHTRPIQYFSVHLSTYAILIEKKRNLCNKSVAHKHMTQGVPHLYDQEFASIEFVIVKVNCWEIGAKFLRNSVDFELLKNKTNFVLNITKSMITFPKTFANSSENNWRKIFEIPFRRKPFYS